MASVMDAVEINFKQEQGHEQGQEQDLEEEFDLDKYLNEEPDKKILNKEIILENKKYQDTDYESFDQIEILLEKPELLKGIMDYGFEKPSLIQARAIQPMFDRKDLVAQSQSGTGKTGAFTIGMLTIIDPNEYNTQGIILANTRELATQIYNVITKISYLMKINIALCIGGAGGKDVKTNLNEASTSHIWVGTPGRVLDLLQRYKEQKNANLISKLKLLVLDEADILLTDGFIDNIKLLVNNFISNQTQICIFSATYSKEIHNIIKSLTKPNPVKILVEQEKISLDIIKHYLVNAQQEKNKYEVLMDIYHKINICQAVIFVNSIDKAETLGFKLNSEGHSVGIIHSKMDDITRYDTLINFRKMETRVLVATDIISRGIDVQQVGLVINYDIPSTPEQYIHRVGRSGRYGKTGVAINFVTETNYDLNKIRDVETSYKIKIPWIPKLENINHYLTGTNGYNYLDLKNLAIKE